MFGTSVITKNKLNDVFIRTSNYSKRENVRLDNGQVARLTESQEGHGVRP